MGGLPRLGATAEYPVRFNDHDFDLLVDVGGDTIEEALDRVVAVRAFPGIGRTSTAFADLADAIRPQQS